MAHPAIISYLTHLTHLGRAPTTISSYRCALTQAAAAMPSGLLAYPEEIEAWLGQWQKPATRGLYLTALRGFYRWATGRSWIDADPTAGLESIRPPRRTPRPCTTQELAHLLDRAGDPVRLWCVIALYTGARCIEISRLHREHITAQSTRLTGKGGHERTVPTHPDLWAEVAGLPPGPITSCSAHSISQTIARACDQIGLPDVTAHRLRHTAATWWQQATGDIRVTQELLGHASVATTQVYAAVADEAMRRAVAGMPSITRPGSIGDDAAPGSEEPLPPPR